MLSEARKRDHVANAVLALSFAANAAQSPKDLVRSGNVEGPGVQLMSRMMKKRGEAERNLDSGRVSHPARNRKMKTFKEFVEEAYEYIGEDAASYARRQANKQARGREGKTPLYVDRTTKKVEKSPEGKWKVKKTTEKKMNPKASVGKFKQNPTNLPSVQGGGHGGAGFGYGPHKHGTGGIHRGVKKKEQKQTPETKLNKFQRKSALAKSKHYRTGGSTMQSGLVGDRAAERIRERARKSFGAWSKEKG